jgi:hypothetical protein
MTRALVGMKLERSLIAAGIAVTAITSAFSVAAARAADITRTYDITASGFVAAFGNSPPPPINSFDASFTVTFDPTVKVVARQLV